MSLLFDLITSTHYLFKRTETLAMTEGQQQRLQVCENNWVQKIARVTRADRRRMVELRGRDGSAEEHDRETGEEQTTVGRTRRKDVR